MQNRHDCVQSVYAALLLASSRTDLPELNEAARGFDELSNGITNGVYRRHGAVGCCRFNLHNAYPCGSHDVTQSSAAGDGNVCQSISRGCQGLFKVFLAKDALHLLLAKDALHLLGI
jgi:hypothetical protein